MRKLLLSTIITIGLSGCASWDGDLGEDTPIYPQPQTTAIGYPDNV